MGRLGSVEHHRLMLSDADRRFWVDTFLKQGYVMFKSWPHKTPNVRLDESVDELLNDDADTLWAVKPDWIVGKIASRKIEGGFRSGTYSVVPRRNFYGIELTLPALRKVTGVPRLSSVFFTVRGKYFVGSEFEEVKAGASLSLSLKELNLLVSSLLLEVNFVGEEYLISKETFDDLCCKKVRPAFDFQDGEIVNLCS